MLFLDALTHLLRKRSHAKTAQTRTSTPLRLEVLEDRVTPSFTGVAWTYTNATVNIAPSLATFSVTETVTANVTTVPFLNPTTGITSPVPAGAGTPTGTVQFNLNNQTQTASLNANGQATATFTLPVLSLLSSQALQVSYQGTTNAAVGRFAGSTFLAPLYENYNNVLLPATLTFGQLTPPQEFANVTFSTTSAATPTTLPQVFYTAQGEKDQVGFFTYNYSDPGIINTVSVLGFQLPGLFAFATGAYNGLTTGSSSSSSI